MREIYKCKECGLTFDKYPILCDFCRGKEFEIKEEEIMSKKWTYELDINRDIWRGGVFNSREEAIEEATKEALIDDIEKFKIGVIKDVPNFGVDVDTVIEDIQNAMYDEIGEVAEDYLDDVSKGHLLELEEQLNEVFYKWQEKYNYKPTFYSIISEEMIEIKKEIGNKKQCTCSKYGKSLNSGIKCSNCGREL